MGSFSSRIRGTAAIIAIATGALTALPVAASAGTNSTFVPCNAGEAGLKTAVNNANLGTGPRTINLASGCAYFLTTAFAGNNGLPLITSNITLKGKDATIRRFSALTFRIAEVGANGRLTAQGITFAGGSIGAGLNGGGGILVDSGGRLELTDGRVTQNASADFGGGVQNSTSGTVKLFNTIVNNNHAATNGGGLGNDGSLTVVGGLIGFNTSVNSGAGIGTGGTTSLTSTDVVHNTTATGSAGGIFIVGGNVALRESRVQFNTSSTASGGGIDNAGGILQVVKSRLSDNQAGTGAGDVGGALVNRTGGTTTIRNSTLTRNAANDGGAIARLGGSVTAINSVIANNFPNNCIGTVPGCSG